MLRDFLRAGLSLLAPALTHSVLRLYVGRVLGEEALGLYSLTWAIYSIALMCGTLGAGPALTRYAASLQRSLVHRSRLLGAGLAQALAGTLLAGLLLVLIAAPPGRAFSDIGALSRLLLIAAAALPGASTGKVVSGCLNGQRRMSAFATIAVAQSATTLLVTVLLVASGYGVAGAVAGLLLPAAAIGLLSLLAVRTDLPRTIASGSIFRASPALLRFGLYVTLTNGVGLVQGYTDTLMLGAFLTQREVGLYAAALLGLQVIRFPGMAAQLAVNPRIAVYWPRGELTHIERAVNGSLGAVATLVLPVAFVFVLGGESLLGWTMGVSFHPAATALALLLPGAALAGIWAAAGTLLSSTGHVQCALRISLLSAIANVVLNALLIPRYGIEGGAVATGLSLAMGCTAEAIMAQRRTGVRLRGGRIAVMLALLTTAVGARLVAGITVDSPGTLGLLWLVSLAVCLVVTVDRDTLTAAIRRFRVRRPPSPSR